MVQFNLKTERVEYALGHFWWFTLEGTDWLGNYPYNSWPSIRRAFAVEIGEWLYENVGDRKTTWNATVHHNNLVITIYDDESAMLFKLRFS